MNPENSFVPVFPGFPNTDEPCQMEVDLESQIYYPQIEVQSGWYNNPYSYYPLTEITLPSQQCQGCNNFLHSNIDLSTPNDCIDSFSQYNSQDELFFSSIPNTCLTPPMVPSEPTTPVPPPPTQDSAELEEVHHTELSFHLIDETEETETEAELDTQSEPAIHYNPYKYPVAKAQPQAPTESESESSSSSLSLSTTLEDSISSDFSSEETEELKTPLLRVSTPHPGFRPLPPLPPQTEDKEEESSSSWTTSSSYEEPDIQRIPTPPPLPSAPLVSKVKAPQVQPETTEKEDDSSSISDYTYDYSYEYSYDSSESSTFSSSSSSSSESEINGAAPSESQTESETEVKDPAPPAPEEESELSLSISQLPVVDLRTKKLSPTPDPLPKVIPSPSGQSFDKLIPSPSGQSFDKLIPSPPPLPPRPLTTKHDFYKTKLTLASPMSCSYDHFENTYIQELLEDITSPTWDPAYPLKVVSQLRELKTLILETTQPYVKLLNYTKNIFLINRIRQEMEKQFGVQGRDWFFEHLAEADETGSESETESDKIKVDHSLFPKNRLLATLDQLILKYTTTYTDEEIKATIMADQTQMVQQYSDVRNKMENLWEYIEEIKKVRISLETMEELTQGFHDELQIEEDMLDILEVLDDMIGSLVQTNIMPTLKKHKLALQDQFAMCHKATPPNPKPKMD